MQFALRRGCTSRDRPNAVIEKILGNRFYEWQTTPRSASDRPNKENIQNVWESTNKEPITSIRCTAQEFLLPKPSVRQILRLDFVCSLNDYFQQTILEPVEKKLSVLVAFFKEQTLLMAHIFVTWQTSITF